jgi:hypothetical protein
MRVVIIYPWQVEEFVQWLTPDVSGWKIDDVVRPPSGKSREEDVRSQVLAALSRYDCLRWFEDGKLVGSKNEEPHEITRSFKDYRFNGLFYSGLFDTEGEPLW